MYVWSNVSANIVVAIFKVSKLKTGLYSSITVRRQLRGRQGPSHCKLCSRVRPASLVNYIDVVTSRYLNATNEEPMQLKSDISLFADTSECLHLVGLSKVAIESSFLVRKFSASISPTPCLQIRQVYWDMPVA